MKLIASPAEGPPNDKSLFDTGIGYLGVLSGWPFECWDAGYPSYNDKHTGLPDLSYEVLSRVEDDGVYSGGIRCGFLEALRWPSFSVDDMSVRDETPIANFSVVISTITEPEIHAQIEVSGVFDEGILGPFDSGRFVWHGVRKVLYVAVQREKELYLLSDEELADLNSTIIGAMLGHEVGLDHNERQNSGAVAMLTADIP